MFLFAFSIASILVGQGSTSASTSQNAANEDLRRKLEHFVS